MNNKPFSFYEVYSKDKQAIDSAIINSVYDSSSKIAAVLLRQLFSIKTFGINK